MNAILAFLAIFIGVSNIVFILVNRFRRSKDERENGYYYGDR